MNKIYVISVGPENPDGDDPKIRVEFDGDELDLVTTDADDECTAVSLNVDDVILLRETLDEFLGHNRPTPIINFEAVVVEAFRGVVKKLVVDALNDGMCYNDSSQIENFASCMERAHEQFRKVLSKLP